MNKNKRYVFIPINIRLNEYDFYDENNIPTYFKKYNISIEEWFDLLKGKNFEDF